VHPNMILTIFKKDVRDAIRDSRVIAALLIPIGLGIFYNFMFDDDEFTVPPVTVAIHMQGSSQLPEALSTTTEGAVDLQIQMFDQPEQVRKQVEDENADIGIVIPDGFDDQVAAGDSPQLDLIIPHEVGASSNYVLAALEATLRDMAGRAPPATLVFDAIPAESEDEISVFENLGPRQYFVLASLIMLIGMNAMLVVPIILAEEAEKKTLDALIMVASYVDVVIAKALVGLFYIGVTGTILVLVTGVPVANMPLFIGSAALFAISLIGFGLLIGSMFNNANQVNTWGGFFLLPVIAPAFMVGFPLPDAVNTVLDALSTSQAMRLMINAIAGETLFKGVWLSLLVLVIWIVGAYGLLVLRLSRRQA
jgi:ABC-2 type transport system permease protein